jgi:hypothetical protein
LNVSQFADFGGVDSRSNPLAMPKNRSLRCRNWVPQRDGHLELRWGYATVSLSSINPTPIASLTGYTLFDGTAYVVYPQQLNLYRMAMADGTVTTLPVRGVPISGFHRWSWAFANNNMYGFNTTDAKFMSADGTLRDIGLRALTAAEAAAVVVSIGAPDPTGAILTHSLGVGGLGYAVNDTGSVQGTGYGGTYKVLTVSGGAVLTYSLIAAGRDYITGNGTSTLAGGTQPGVGSGFTINILTVSDGGLPASTVGGDQPGYQYHASIYDRIIGHVGNHVAIGGRIVPTVDSDIDMQDLPDLSGINSEWDLLIGRTIDGGETPYAQIDDSAEYIYVPNGTTAVTLNKNQIDFTSPLPYRNVPPQMFAQVVRVADRFFAYLPNDPHVFYTESAADTEASGQFQYVGDAQQSWPLDNFETFPTGQAITCLAGDTQNCWVFTRNKMGLLNDAAGIMTWQGELDTGGSILFTLTWKRKITPLGRQYCHLRASAIRTSGQGSGSSQSGWTTPQAHDVTARGSGQKAKHGTKHGCADLNQDAQMSGWPTPNTPSGGPNMTSTATHTGGMDLDGAALLASWPTPNTMDVIDRPNGMRPSRIATNRESEYLSEIAPMASWATPAARDYRSKSATDEFNETRWKHARGKPLTAEATMAGWPTPMAGSPATETYNEAGNNDSSLKTVEIASGMMAGWVSPKNADMKGNPYEPTENRRTELRKQVSLTGAIPSGSGAGTESTALFHGQLNPSLSRCLQNLPEVWDLCAFLVKKKEKK